MKSINVGVKSSSLSTRSITHLALALLSHPHITHETLVLLRVRARKPASKQNQSASKQARIDGFCTQNGAQTISLTIKSIIFSVKSIVVQCEIAPQDHRLWYRDVAAGCDAAEPAQFHA